MSKLNISRTECKVSEFISWQRDGMLILNPNFQRRHVWKKGAKSYFMDTIIRGLPVPVIFIRDLPTDLETLKSKREVVDGQQRLRTLISFIAPDLIKDFNPEVDDFKIMGIHHSKLRNAKFVSMPDHIKERILDYTLTVHTFPSDTDDREIYDIFARINATGVNLNGQELRNAKWYGEFKTLAYQLALKQLNRWIGWQVFTPIDIARMKEVEFTSELLILIIQGITQMTKKTIDNIYNKYDEILPGYKEIKNRFKSIFDLIEDRMSEEAISLFNNKTTFYCLFAALYQNVYGLKSELKRTKALTLSKRQLSTIISRGDRLALKNAPRRVVESTERHTSHINSRRIITNYFLGK